LPTGDPTLLHPDYPQQPVINFFKKQQKNISISSSNWQEEPLGRGWSWDDFNDEYDVERSPLPVYGNVIRWEQEQQADSSFISYSIPDVNWKVNFNTQAGAKNFFVQRKMDENIYEITQGMEKAKEQLVPFVTNGLESAVELLQDTIKPAIHLTRFPLSKAGPLFSVIHTQPVDSLLQPMMYRSDNFFAEQTLLMVSNEYLGLMNDHKMIDTLLKTDLKGLPQKPNWVDGCGLSRLDLFTPQDFVWLLNKMKEDFGLERIKHILPTGGKGTLHSRFLQDKGAIFAKTGSLTGVVALSGYLITRKNRLLIFSVLVNNHVGGAALLRDATEKFIEDLRSSY
jgi:D-alanyl-D-alanine carboxypeptidase/D-alanyl-D-alanine-endopeptidase (penicillin-binding protein 4)